MGHKDKKYLVFEQTFMRRLRLTGVAVHELEYKRSHDGQSIYAIRFTPAKVIGRVLFAHSVGNDLLFPHVRLFNELTRAGYEVAAFDLDGHGRRSHSVITNGSLRSALGDAFRNIFPHSSEPVHLMGYSLGGALALGAQLDEPNLPVKSVTAIGTPMFLDKRVGMFVNELKSFAKPSLLQALPHYLWSIFPAVGWFRRKQYPIRMDSSQWPADANGFERTQQLINRYNFLDLLTRTNRPTHLIFGGEDRIAAPPSAAQAKLFSPTVTHEIISGETHWTVPLAAETVAACVAFLKKVDR